MLRNSLGGPYTCILQPTLFSRLPSISRSIGYQWRRIRTTCHCHVSQPARLWQYVYSTRTVQSTSSGGKSSLCRHQSPSRLALTPSRTFCFLPFSLASFPKAFELVDLKKGFFPHLFNTPENQSYVGPIPPSDTYDPDSMNHDKRQEFLSWYQDQVRWRVLHYWCQIIESGLPKIFRRIFSRGAIWSHGTMYHDYKCL